LTDARTGVSLSSAFGTPLKANGGEVEECDAETVSASWGVRRAEGFGVSFLRCRCGYTLTSIASPGRIVHKLLSEHGVERFQDAVDAEVRTTGDVDWPEPWDTAGYAECWLCPQCGRLFVGLNGPDSAVRVFTPESVGIAPEDTGLDSQLAPLDELYAIGMREAGESPLCPKPAEPGATADGGGV
jgi:hypothetical protein